MSWSFSIGRLFGSELRVHATFFLLLAWIGVAAWSNGGPQAALQNLAFVLALFACVVAHEFGHALTARRYGIQTPDITLLPIGGLARLERMPEKPAQVSNQKSPRSSPHSSYSIGSSSPPPLAP